MSKKIEMTNDPNCFVHWVKNDKMKCAIDFTSSLEEFHPELAEHPEFQKFTLKPGERKLVPHGYFRAIPQDGSKKVSLSQEFVKEGEGVNFYYAKKPGYGRKGRLQVVKPTDDVEFVGGNVVTRALRNLKLRIERAWK